MFRWAIAFLIIALIAGALGFGVILEKDSRGERIEHFETGSARTEASSIFADHLADPEVEREACRRVENCARPLRSPKRLTV